MSLATAKTEVPHGGLCNLRGGERSVTVNKAYGNVPHVCTGVTLTVPVLSLTNRQDIKEVTILPKIIWRLCKLGH